jgi:endoglucanase
MIAARRAWAAAQVNPSVFASPDDSNGGGPYNDEQVTDEFYWAAAELFITTGNDEFRAALTGSPHQSTFPMQAGGATGSITWARTDGLGKISLSVVPNDLGEAALQRLRAQIVGPRIGISG